MLILSNPPPRGWAVPSASSLASYIQEHAEERANSMSLGKKEREALIPKLFAEIKDEPLPIRATLIVLPHTLLNQWLNEVSLHVKEGELTIGLYDSDSSVFLRRSGAGSNALPSIPTCLIPAAVLRRQSQRLTTAVAQKGGSKDHADSFVDRMPLTDLDICFMSYEQMRNEIKTRDSVLTRFGFWRIMLDEAQLVAQSNSVAAVMASSLWRRHAWVVTGTPISNSVDELRGLCEFLSLEPFYHPKAWNNLVKNPYQSRSLPGLLTMRGLVRGVMLRRTKADVQAEMTELPPCIQEDCLVTLSPIERVAYEQIRRKYRDQVSALKRNLQIHQSNLARGNEAREMKRHSTQALAWLTALRQTCCHPQIVKADSVGGQGCKDKRVVSTMREIMTKLVTKAFSELDGAAGDLISTKVKTAAIRLSLCLAGGSTSTQSDIASAAQIIQETRAEINANLDLFRGSGKGIRWVAQQRDRDGRSLMSSFPPPAVKNDGEQAVEGVEGTDEDLMHCERRWLKVLLDAEILNAYILRRSFPPVPCDGSPVKAESTPLVSSSLRDGDENKRKRQNVDEGSVKAAKAHQDQGPSSSAHAAAVARDWAATTLSSLKEAEISLRLSLGFPPISFLDELEERLANMRRSGRNAALNGFGGLLTSAPMVIDDMIPEVKKQEEEEVEDEVRASRSARVARRTTAAGGRGRLLDDDDFEPEEDEEDENDHEEEEGESEESGERGKGSGRGSKKLLIVKAPVTGEERIMRSEIAIRNLAILLDKRDPIKSSLVNEAQSLKNYQKSFSNLMHLLSQEEEQLEEEAKQREREREVKGEEEGQDQGIMTDPAAPQGSLAAAQGGKMNKDAIMTCPICLDRPERKTITSCGHSYCTDCIWEIINSSSHQSNCPICRKPLTAANLFDSISEKDAAKVAEEAERLGRMANHEFGAKVSSMLLTISECLEADPSTKFLVFSSWGRLLRLVGDALGANGINHCSLAGASPDARMTALSSFKSDPQAKVLCLLMSNASGAAGLTLTEATVAFILEPSISPGLEAQASARIHRMGQTKPTRVIRFIARDTIEERVLDLQRHKQKSGGKKREGPQDNGGAGVEASTSAATTGGGGGGDDHEAQVVAEAGVQGGVEEIDGGVILQFFDV